MINARKSFNAGDSHVNTGTVTLRLPDNDTEFRAAPMTMIVSGVGRSGTSMIAKLLYSLDIPMGKTEGLPVFEDQELHRAIFNFDHDLLQRLVNDRNSTHRRWGFKYASLQRHIFPRQIEYFRNPRLLIVMRDVVATANRSHISEEVQQDFTEKLREVNKQASELIDFILRATCPTLLISYEKFINQPDQGIDAVAAFCGITVSNEMREQARQAIEPNNPEYIELFHPKLRGNFDAVEHGFLLGWCAAEASAAPIDVELLADGKVLARMRADIYRADLLAAGIGTGRNGFRFNISALGLRDNAILAVRAVGTKYIVANSGRSLGDFPAR